MNEDVAVVIKTSPETAQAFLKVFPGAQIRRIKKPESKPPETEKEPIKAEKREDREKLLNEIVAFCQSRNSKVDGFRFFSYYDGRGWLDGAGNKITDWKQKVVEWENNGIADRPQKPSQITGSKVVKFSKDQMDKYMEDLEKI